MIQPNYKKAQSSIEFLILMSFLTLIIIGILTIGYFYSNTINDRIKSNQIGNLAKKIISASEAVFYAGKPSKATISVNIAKEVTDIEIINNAIVITYRLSTGQNKVAFSSNVPIAEDPTAEISSEQGIKNLVIEANLTHAVIAQN